MRPSSTNATALSPWYRTWNSDPRGTDLSDGCSGTRMTLALVARSIGRISSFARRYARCRTLTGEKPRERQRDRARLGDALEAGRERYPIQGRGAVRCDRPVAEQSRPVRSACHCLLDAGPAVAENARDVVPARNVLPPTVGPVELLVRRLCEGRGAIGDRRIGQLLSRAPSEKDGPWPCRSVCEVLETIACQDIAAGFEMGVYNARGVHSRSLDEGGKQERGFVGEVSATLRPAPRAAGCRVRLSFPRRRADMSGGR